MALGTCAATALVATLAGASSARADTALVQSVALDYSAPATCPPESHFRVSVEELTRAVRFDAAASRRFVVRIDERKDARAHARFSGSVREGANAGAPSVEAGDCHDVAAALALTVALALDPDALSAAEPAARAPSAPPPSQAPPSSTAPPPAIEPSSQHEEADVPERFGLELGLAASLHFARGPGDATPLAAIGMEVLHRVPWRASVELDVGGGGSENVKLRLRWEPSARLALCPLWWEPARGLFLVGCAGGEVSRLVSEGGVALDAPLPEAVRTFWAVDARARARFRFAPVVVEVFGGAELPLSHIEYREASLDGSSRLIFEVDQRVGGVAGVGVSAEIF